MHWVYRSSLSNAFVAIVCRIYASAGCLDFVGILAILWLQICFYQFWHTCGYGKKVLHFLQLCNRKDNFGTLL